MDFHDVVRGRESIRNYDPARPIERVVLERILEAGRLAPSAHNNQPWRFIVAASAEALARIKPCYARPWFQDVPQILIVAGDAAASWVRSVDGYNSIETDLTIAMTHLILAAEAEGVATCWLADFQPDLLRRALGLKENERVFAMTPLGYPKPDFRKKGQKIRKDLSEVAQFI